MLLFHSWLGYAIYLNESLVALFVENSCIPDPFCLACLVIFHDAFVLVKRLSLEEDYPSLISKYLFIPTWIVAASSKLFLISRCTACPDPGSSPHRGNCAVYDRQHSYHLLSHFYRWGSGQDWSRVKTAHPRFLNAKQSLLSICLFSYQDVIEASKLRDTISIPSVISHSA